jgi:proteasome lid subunit RPN8/RPN11
LTLIISSAYLDAMIDQARREQPNECCGLLAGRDGEVLGVIQTTNADGSPTSFRVDPLELLRAFEGMEYAGLDLVGIYHSHPASPARMSPTDLKYAPGYPEVAHVIISLAGEGATSPPNPLSTTRRVGAEGGGEVMRRGMGGQGGCRRPSARDGCLAGAPTPEVRAFRVVDRTAIDEEVLIR